MLDWCRSFGLNMQWIWVLAEPSALLPNDGDRKLFSGICSLECDILKVPKHEDAKQISRKSDNLTSNTSEISFGMWNLECDIGMVRGPLGFLESGIFLESSRGLLGIWNLIWGECEQKHIIGNVRLGSGENLESGICLGNGVSRCAFWNLESGICSDSVQSIPYPSDSHPILPIPSDS